MRFRCAVLSLCLAGCADAQPAHEPVETPAVFRYPEELRPELAEYRGVQ